MDLPDFCKWKRERRFLFIYFLQYNGADLDALYLARDAGNERTNT
jgi:hypothetical protein